MRHTQIKKKKKPEPSKNWVKKQSPFNIFQITTEESTCILKF